jgi:hypothetical protein
VPANTNGNVHHVERVFCKRKGRDPQFFVTVLDSKDDLKYCAK